MAGLILAGGESSRMGTDKALLRLGGVTLLDRTRRLLDAAGADRIVVAGRPDVEGGVADASPGAGPARAAADALLGLSDAGYSLALVVPVDMPFMTADVLDPLIAAASIGGAAYEGHPLPFSARLHSPTLETLEPNSLRDLLDGLGGVRLPGDDLDQLVFANVNTPQDWRRLTGQD